MKTSRWPGVILSVFVPGFGLFRARQTSRGWTWLIAFQLASLLVTLLMVNDLVPISLGVAAFIGAFVFQVWMWCDSFRPGRMTFGLWIAFFVLFAAIWFLPSLGNLVGRPFRMPTGAMEPTLMGARSASGADHVLVDRFCYRIGKPRRGDIIVFTISAIPGITEFSKEEDVFFMKRIVGLPGEHIEIRDGKVFADGIALGDSEGIPPINHINPHGTLSSARKDGEAYVVGDGEFFVMGDNSPNSYDSRHWGCVPERSVYGKVTKIYFPFNRIGRPRFVSPASAIEAVGN